MRAATVATLARAAARWRLAPAAEAARGYAAGTPTFTGTVYKESEKARENAFFSKQDEMALRKLLTKVKSSADSQCTTAGAHSAKEEAALKAIVGKYKLEAKDMEGACGARGGVGGATRPRGFALTAAFRARRAALMKWRHSTEY